MLIVFNKLLKEIGTRSILVHDEELHKQKGPVKKRKEKNIGMRDAWGK